jgi:hypothetical protein
MRQWRKRRRVTNGAKLATSGGKAVVIGGDHWRPLTTVVMEKQGLIGSGRDH